MSTKLVTFDEFNPANLTGSDPIPQSIKKPNETINYNDIKLSYNYGTETDPIIQDLFFECPVVTSTGIKTKEEPAQGKNGSYTKTTNSMMMVFDLADSETRDDAQRGLDKINELHRASAQAVGKYKGKLKMHQFDANDPRGDFKNPIYWPRDENSEIIKGKNPNIWVKLRNNYNKTLFTDLEGRPIDWKLLNNVNLTILPLLHVEKIYVGSKASLQIYLASAIVLKIVPAGTESRQTSTMERLKAKYGNLAEQVDAQLADLRMTRQDELQASVSSTNNMQHDEGTMHNIPTPSPETTSVSDFLSGAPTMTETSLPQAPVSLPSQPIKLNVQRPN